jgi:IS1 family transposase/transposase-like protein
MINAETHLFCPRKSCEYYQSLNNKIIKDGFYQTKNDPVPRQMFICKNGCHRFSETGYSEIFHKHGSFKEYEQTTKLTCYGLHTEAIADVLGKDIRTIATWQKNIGNKSKLFHFFVCIIMSFCISELQMDELWSYLGSKAKQLWVFIGFDPKTKFWVNFVLGSRTNHSAFRLISGIKKLVVFPKDTVLRITTDKLAAYKNAIERLLIGVNYAYLQIVKQRYKKILRTVKKIFVVGTEENFPKGTQNTSFIERFNLTLRQRLSYLTRKTLG